MLAYAALTHAFDASLYTNFTDWLVKKGFAPKTLNVFEDETNKDLAAWISLWVMDQYVHSLVRVSFY